MWCSHQFVLVIAYSITAITSIQTKHRPPRFTDLYNTNELPLHFDWEHGLRESTIQALYKENLSHANVHHLIYSAPLLGKQTTASPFGDIAVLARGQLYVNHAGFIFVQDQHSTECDDCDEFSGLCLRNHCQVWHPKQNEHLVALWTVRRIRHRYLSESPHYEIEYIISPINTGYQHNAYLTKQGYLNYNIPGHIFVLRLGGNQQQQQLPLHHRHHKNGVFIAQTSDGSKYILESFPTFLTSEPPRHYGATKYPSTTPSTTGKEYSQDEKKIYQTLLEVLHKKTSPQTDSFTPTNKPITTLKTTTLTQVSTNKLVPLTKPQAPLSTKPTPNIIPSRLPSTTNSYSPQKITSTTLNQHILSTYPITTYKSYPATEFHTITNSITQPQTYLTSPVKPQTTPALFTTQIYPITKPLQETTGTTSTQVLTTPTQYTTSSQPITTKQTIPTPITRPLPPKQNTVGIQNIMSTTPRTTFHYFVAEEQPKTTSDSKPLYTTTIDEFDDYDNTLPSTKTSPTSIKTTFSTEQFIPTTKQYITTNKEFTTTNKEFTTTNREHITTNGKYTTTNREYTTTNRESNPSLTMEKTGTTYFTTEPTTKSTPLYSSEADIIYISTQYQQPSAFTIPITVYDPTEPDDQHKETSSFPVDDNGLSQPSINIQFPTTQFTKPSTTYQNNFTTIPSTTEIIMTQTNSVHTTLGQTTVMESIYNDTTGMTFHTIDDSKQTVKTTEKNAIADTTEFTIKTTAPLLSTFYYTTNTHQTTSTISYDNISMHTTPTTQRTETIGTRKTEKYTSTEKSNFLLEAADKDDFQVPLYQKPTKDYNEDDIFGSTKSTTIRTETPMKQYTKSDIEIALFDRTNNRKSKSLKLSKPSTTIATPQVVYANYFEASTIAMSTQIPPTITAANTILTPSTGTTKLPRKKFSVKRRKTTTSAPTLTTENLPTATRNLQEIEPVTRQSYLTSISFEVNKRSKTPYVAQTKSQKIENTEKTLHNDIALRLIGEIKGAEYLDQSSTTPRTRTTYSQETTTKRRKYIRRKSYIPRSKRPTKKKNTKPEVT